MLPKDYKALAFQNGIVAGGVVEASPLVKDNQWVLDLIAGDRFFKFFVGSLEIGAPDFSANLRRFAQDPRFVGIRGYLWSPGAITLDEVEHTRRHAGFVQHFGEDDGIQRSNLGRLEDHRAARRERWSDFRGDLIERPVPRSDERTDADRFVNDAVAAFVADSGLRDDLRRLAGDRSDVEFVEFEPDLTRRYERADVVVSMAGYNTVCELLTAGVRAVLVPRAEPVQEQLIRARRLAAAGHFRAMEPSELTPARLIAATRAALADTAMPPSRIDMEGLTRVRALVQRLLDGRIA